MSIKISQYNDSTYNSTNPMVRFAHRRRLEISLGIIGSEGNIRLLDFGCGDELFLNHLAEQCGRRAEELIG